MIDLTNLPVEETLTRLCKASPDFRYDGDPCMYVKDGEPSCLVGQVLHELGVPIERLEACDNSAFPGILSLIRAGWFTATPRQHELLGAVQNFQDAGDPWGQCLGQALIAARDL